ncbi:MAG: GNAT family N-acetyltransferase [Cyanobacteria bacterium P01_H01_bin.15]
MNNSLSPNAAFLIRSAHADDVPGIFNLIISLAEYEGLRSEVSGNANALRSHLFAPNPVAEALVAIKDNGVAGYALFYPNYSTFLTQPGIYLEDLCVSPAYRRQGIGTALLRRVIHIAKERQVGRLEWNVLEWNAPAIALYQNLGAEILPDWRTCRMTAQTLREFKQGLRKRAGNADL